MYSAPGSSHLSWNVRAHSHFHSITFALQQMASKDLSRQGDRRDEGGGGGVVAQCRWCAYVFEFSYDLMDIRIACVSGSEAESELVVILSMLCCAQDDMSAL